MNVRDFVLLDVLNIASTDYGTRHTYEATAIQILDTLIRDKRFEEFYGVFGSPQEIVGHLTQLGKGWPRRRQPLVRRTRPGHWQLTKAGIDVLLA